MESIEGRRLHEQAAQARERNELAESVKLVFQAFEQYEKDGDHLGTSEVLSDASITLRNRGELEDNQDYLMVALGFANSSLDIAISHAINEALSVPYFNLGKIFTAMGVKDKAVDNFQKALANLVANPPASHANRPAVLANYQVHLSIAQYSNGDKDAIQRAEEATHELENAPESDDYSKKVWVSGAYMDLASAIAESDNQKAQDYLKRAQEIIDSDSRLKIRKEQLAKLAKSF